jgi:hypothetical protein
MHTNTARIAGLDYGRATAALFVLLWHEHFFGKGEMFNPAVASPFLPSLVDILNANLLLQAVPFFIFLSCYLYVSRGPGAAPLKRRLSRITTLHIFWGCAYFLVVGGLPALAAASGLFLTRPYYATVTAMGSFYFFSSLLLTIALTHIACQLRSSWLIAITGLSCLMVVAMQIATVKFGINWASAFWSPFNYLPTPPLVVLLVRHLKGNQAGSILIAGLAVAFVGAVAAEWALLANPVFTQLQGYAMPAYTRISPALFSCLAVCLLLKVRREPPTLIAFMSRYALAAYCLQAFALMGTAGLDLPIIPKTVLDLSVTYLLAFLLGKFVLKSQLLESGHRP